MSIQPGLIWLTFPSACGHEARSCERGGPSIDSNVHLPQGSEGNE